MRELMVAPQLTLSALLATLAVLVMLAVPASAETEAAKSPLGIGDAQASAPAAAQPSSDPGTALLTYITNVQRALNQRLSTGIRDLKSEGSLSAALALAAIGFLYGVFHAAGPGHGKAIVTSYVLASERTIRHGIYLSFLAGFFQALSAIAIVGLLSVAFRASGLRIQAIAAQLETASYLLIVLIGAWLLYGQLRGLFHRRSSPHDHDHEDPHHHHDHAGHHHHGGHHDHAHLPSAERMGESWHWGKALALAAAVGVRPCSGAILVLVFALAQGIFWAGVAATFAMALGTSLMVSVLAMMAVGSRRLASRAGGGSTVWVDRVETIAGIGGASLVLGLGLLFFLASLGPRQPF